MEPSIRVENLGKRYRKYSPHRSYTLQEIVVRGFRDFRKHPHFWALRGVNFELLPGKMTGIVGRNGSGKSTLLRVVGGVNLPEEGRVTVNGRIGALIDLGAGFHPELTGRENLLINAVISGLSRREAARRLAKIIQFAELEGFVDSPLRTYSSGMQLRLGFAIAIHTDPEVLLVDEVLAVGDASFQTKCLERIAEIKNQGCAILLVSHDTSLVSRLCDEALWLNAGQVAARGPAEEVTRLYLDDIKAESQMRSQTHPLGEAGGDQHKNRLGTLEMEISGVWLLDENYREIKTLESGQPLKIRLAYHAPNRLASPIFTASVVRNDGMVCLDSSTQAAGMVLPDLEGRGTITLNLDRLDLAPGTYTVDVGVFPQDWAHAYDYHWQAYPLEIIGQGGGKGALLTPQHWVIKPDSGDESQNLA
jgi:lipopolysaccharide transport system ATP-binding protein